VSAVTTPTAVPRRAVAALAALATLLAPAAGLVHPGGAQAQTRTPWATINACDPAGAPGAVGVRVSVPNRRDAAQWLRIRIQFFDASRRAWRVVRTGGDTGFRRLSRGRGRFFGGTTFTITPPKAGSSIKLRGLADIQWRRGRRVVSRAQVRTQGGHFDGDDPLLQVSAPTCVITR
jgi:hypothetical protein